MAPLFKAEPIYNIYFLDESPNHKNLVNFLSFHPTRLGNHLRMLHLKKSYLH